MSTSAHPFRITEEIPGSTTRLVDAALATAGRLRNSIPYRIIVSRFPEQTAAGELDGAVYARLGTTTLLL